MWYKNCMDLHIYLFRQAEQSSSLSNDFRSATVPSQGTWMVPLGLGSLSCHWVKLIPCQLVIHAAGWTARIARGDLRGLIPRIRSPIANKVAVTIWRVPKDGLLEGKLDCRLLCGNSRAVFCLTFGRILCKSGRPTKSRVHFPASTPVYQFEHEAWNFRQVFPVVGKFGYPFVWRSRQDEEY